MLKKSIRIDFHCVYVLQQDQPHTNYHADLQQYKRLEPEDWIDRRIITTLRGRFVILNLYHNKSQDKDTFSKSHHTEMCVSWVDIEKKSF